MPFSIRIATLSISEKTLDVYLPVCHRSRMAKHIVKVSGNKSCFRVIVPHTIIEEMGWNGATHVIIEQSHSDAVIIRRLFCDRSTDQPIKGNTVNADR